MTDTAHPTTLMVAWGMVDKDLSLEMFLTIRDKIREEIRPYRLKLKNSGQKQLTLRRRSLLGQRTKLLAVGSLRACARRALSEIDPVNYPIPPTDPVWIWEDIPSGPLPANPFFYGHSKGTK